jgi:type II secretory pathway pseudopilin PulG
MRGISVPGKRSCRGFTISELVIVFGIVVLVGALMWPFVRYGHKRMGNMLCANNLREQGLALYIYAREHDGKFPPALKTLYDEQYLADPRIMDCPASKTIGTPDAPDYIYTAGLSVKSSSKAPLVRDKQTNHMYGKNLLYVNGRVSWED